MLRDNLYVKFGPLIYAIRKKLSKILNLAVKKHNIYGIYSIIKTSNGCN